MEMQNSVKNVEKNYNMNTLYDETKFILKKYGIIANKRLGQNFLISDEVVDAIVAAAKLSKTDLVIEIGPGLGNLTKPLLENAGKVVCVELDSNMLQILKERFLLYSNLEIIKQDILKVDLAKLIREEKQKNTNLQTVKVVANLPYYITSPIMMYLLEQKLEIESITVMVQKEVAERFIAIPGQKQAGAITYTIYYYAEGEKVIDVPKDSFIPEPEVDSEVIHLKIRKEPLFPLAPDSLFFPMIKTAFSQRRKTLLNTLVNGNILSSKEEGKKILETLGLPETIRGEALSIEDFKRLAEMIEQKRR